jgi:pilus assembly protein FimV
MEYRGNLMQHKFKLRTATLTLALFAMAVVPSIAWALGLGEIHSETRIGQPFTARIPILNASTGALQGLRVSLAGPAAYKSAHISEPDYLFGLKFSVEQSPTGPYIQVTSKKSVKLPFLNLLIRARWASGEVTRQYTVLLNPPVFVSRSNVRQPVSVPSTPVPPQSVTQQPVSKPTEQTGNAAPATPAVPTSRSVQQTPVASPMPNSYTVHRGDTLWGIAGQLHAHHGVSVNQIMITLYRTNPQAFRGNINRLKAGYTLTVPTQSEITQIEAAAATRMVARQDNEWRSATLPAQTVAGNGEPQQVAAVSTKQSAIRETAPQAVITPVVKSTSLQSAEEPAAIPAISGRVVLTTPEVTTAKSVAAAPGSVVAGTVAGVASAMVTAQTTMKASANATTPAGMAGTGASVGGPLKVQSNAMAGLASAREAATAGAVAVTLKPKAKPVNSVNVINSVNTGGEEQGSGLMYWLQRPSGWIVIAAIILILVVILLFLLRHRRTAPAQQVSAMPTDGETQAADDSEGTDTGEGPDDATPVESAGLETKENPDELGIATYIGGPSLDVNKVDVMDEADLLKGFGDYGKASQILRDGIAHQPHRHELRRKLLDVLFAAGEGDAFAAEAQNYRKETGGAADWEEIVVMGRQLLPHDKLFMNANIAASETPEERIGDSGSDNFADLDLDRLSGDGEGKKEQDEFERTMDELSTFIETYIPESAETPVALQLPPEAQAPVTAPTGSETDAEPTPQDEPLDFRLDDEDLPQATLETAGEAGEDAGELGNMVDTKLDLARAYIDMGDADSARGVLAEVIDEGDDNQSGEAKRLLEGLD